MAKRREQSEDARPFKKGDRVSHAEYGAGVVRYVGRAIDSCDVVFDRGYIRYPDFDDLELIRPQKGDFVHDQKLGLCKVTKTDYDTHPGRPVVNLKSVDGMHGTNIKLKRVRILEPHEASNCCRVPMVVCTEGTTSHYVCTSCGEPCDAYSAPEGLLCPNCEQGAWEIYERRSVKIVGGEETIENREVRSVRCACCGRMWRGEKAHNMAVEINQ